MAISECDLCIGVVLQCESSYEDDDFYDFIWAVLLQLSLDVIELLVEFLLIAGVAVYVYGLGDDDFGLHVLT